jgi:hypothetical protein
MSGEKRPAPEGFGSSSQLVVKRQKSGSDLNATSIALRPGQTDALVKSVRGLFIFGVDTLALLETSDDFIMGH